jgi:hypothetical protein
MSLAVREVWTRLRAVYALSDRVDGGEMIRYAVPALIIGLFWLLVRSTWRRSEREREIAYEAIQHHLATFLRENTGIGP